MVATAEMHAARHTGAQRESDVATSGRKWRIRCDQVPEPAIRFASSRARQIDDLDSFTAE